MNPQRRISSDRSAGLRSRLVLMAASLVVVLCWCGVSGFHRWDGWLFSGLVGVAMAGGVVEYRRVRARNRWEAAWEAYAALHGSRRPISAYQEVRTLSIPSPR